MKYYIFLFSVLFTGILAWGQNTTISEFDLYGCWVLENDDNGKIPERHIYKHCNGVEQDNTVHLSDFSLLAFKMSEFKVMSDDPMNCFGLMYDLIEGSWSFDNKSGIIKIYYPEDYQAAFFERFKEAHPEVEIPVPMLFKKFRIIQLDQNRLELQLLKRG
ncbi:hypothetical protein PP178_01025 [Zeaxanthinibacter sp. PT1]|uniref:hypothetical protein n=1 Tax=Zeaxanthinibacter TaxID=561554 RepID=UPI00234A6E73|nr:hypothetical protein [Zeaxanthinibacter sp. PT1]MDC6350119.1 hypothetical protein [Zeaxanthinibacter sp. PT1]